MSALGTQLVRLLVRKISGSPSFVNCKTQWRCLCRVSPSGSKVIQRSPSNLTRMFSVSLPTSQTSDQDYGKKITVCVEGNIGSGKTMLLDYFASQTDEVQVIQEPVDLWRNVRGHNMLGLMYEDPIKWSFAFQSYVQFTMLTNHETPHTHPLKMMERSIFSAKYCFVENMHQSGLMSDAEYAVITEWFNWIISCKVKVDQIIYLRASPEYCLRRVRERQRDEESAVSLDFLTRLDQLHEDWLIHHRFPLPAPVMVIDANRPIREMRQYYEDHRADILTSSQQVVHT